MFEASAARADEVQPGLAEALGEELALLEDGLAGGPAGGRHPRRPVSRQRVFFLGDQLSGIIDFYFACNDFFAYDLAVCLNAWCFEPDNSFNITKARYMLNAYRGLRPFSDARNSRPCRCWPEAARCASS